MIALLQQFHAVMMNDYVRYVIEVLFPELLLAANFYSELTQEIKGINQKFRMAFQYGDFGAHQHDSNSTLQLRLIMAPNDVLKELGIHIQAQPRAD